jgi:hypothetical protein
MAQMEKIRNAQRFLVVNPEEIVTTWEMKD